MLLLMLTCVSVPQDTQSKPITQTVKIKKNFNSEIMLVNWDQSCTNCRFIPDCRFRQLLVQELYLFQQNSDYSEIYILNFHGITLNADSIDYWFQPSVQKVSRPIIHTNRILFIYPVTFIVTAKYNKRMCAYIMLRSVHSIVHWKQNASWGS